MDACFDAARRLPLLGMVAVLASILSDCDGPTLPGPRGPTDVVGSVHDLQGAPVAFKRVWVDGPGVETNVEGSFRMPNVETPYTLAIEHSSTTYVFQGLWTLDPQITLPIVQSPTSLAYVTGRVPWQPGTATGVFLFGPGVRSDWRGVSDASGAYLLHPTWPGRDTSRPIQLFMLTDGRSQWRFDAYATRSLGITKDQRHIVDVDEDDFHPIEPRAIEVCVERPPGTHHVFAELLIPLPGRGDHAFSGGSVPDGQCVTLQVPVVPDLPLQLLVRGWLPSGRERAEMRVDVASIQTTVQLDLRQPVMLLAPADSVQGVASDATLEWHDPHVGFNVAYRVDLITTAGTMSVYTAATRIDLGDLPPFRNPIAPGSQCWWFVESLHAASRTDDLVAPPGPVAVRDQGWTSSVRRTFWFAEP